MFIDFPIIFSAYGPISIEMHKNVTSGNYEGKPILHPNINRRTTAIFYTKVTLSADINGSGFEMDSSIETKQKKSVQCEMKSLCFGAINNIKYFKVYRDASGQSSTIISCVVIF